MAESNIRLKVDGSDAVQQLNRVNKAAGTLQGTVGKLVGAFAAIQAAKFVFFKTAELETQTKSLQVLTGSLGNAKNIIKELQQFGAVTPFTSSELIETAKRLKAFGFETEKIVDVTKRLGDIAGATGADLGGIATAFGQIQAKGRLQGEELLQLQERGVDLQGTLRKEYDLTAEEFQKALSKGQIGADAVTFALEKLTEKGGKYADGAIAQSDTLNGKLSTLVDGIDTIARALGEVLAPSLKSVFDLAIDTVNAINQAMAAGSITNRQKQGFKVQAEEEVKRFAGQMPGGPFGADEIVVRTNGKTYQGQASSVVSQITNDLINKEVQRLAGDAGASLPKSNVQTLLPSLLGGTRSGGTSGSAGGTGPDPVEEARKLAELSKNRVQALENEALLSSAMNETEKKNFQLNVDIAELQKNAEGFAQRDVEAQVAARIALENKRNEAEKYKTTIEENAKAEADSLARFLSDFDAAFAQRDAQLEAQAEKMDQLYSSIGQTITTGIVDSLTAAVDGTKSLAEVASDTLRSLANIMLKFGLNTFLGGLGGGDPSSIFTKLFGGKRASGGSVSSSKSYLVGERGPELFTPGRSGSIAPNGATGGVNVGTINIQVENTGEQLTPAAQKQLAGQVQGIVLSTLANERRSGGML